MSNKVIYDHKGNKFKSEKEMCKYWNILYCTYKDRKRRGWTLEECLEGKYIYDHKGNKFKSTKDMCDYWSIDYEVYRGRKYSDWTLEECLEKKDMYIYDHKGNKFKSEAEMCRYWNINYSTYNNRKRCGWTLEESLNIIPHIFLGNNKIIHTYLIDNLYLEKLLFIDNSLYCECTLNNDPIVIHSEIVKDICREYNTNRILSSKKEIKVA